ncbi:MAG: putative glycoside hydrolase [Thermodesulfobacteriota bacterium]
MRILKIVLFILISFGFSASASLSKDSGLEGGLFIIPENSGMKWLKEIVHYSRLTGINKVVIHAKTPRGRIYWNSDNKTALETKAVYPGFDIIKAMKYLKKADFKVIAKIDVFIDSNLAEKKPDMALINRFTGKPWKNKNGLKWANPYDKRVWKYNADLAAELALKGFDEIQFDYIRFPSDGVLKNIDYSFNKDKMSKSDAISLFLKYAQAELKPFNVKISADIFGLTAWKKTNFGVGQVLEKIAPYVDTLCPMFYPSHFPAGFYGFENPGDHPETIMKKSMEKILARTDKNVRPWIQAFRYSPEEISAQIKGVKSTGVKSYCAWNSSTRYSEFYKALEKLSGKEFPEYSFYPGIEELKKKGNKIVRGEKRVVNYTDYKKEVTFISLESSSKDYKSPYSYPATVIKTIDEAILDKILKQRGENPGKYSGLYYKALKTAGYMAKETGIDLKKMRPGFIKIEWGKGGRFISDIKNKPVDILSHEDQAEN